MKSYVFAIPTPTDYKNFAVTSGTSTYFVGSNGSGKTRLAVQIEQSAGLGAHRISAHRALAIDESVPKINEVTARKMLRFGANVPDENLAYRDGHRWGGNASTHLLNDFDPLIQVLFAEQSNTALETHNRARAGNAADARPTLFEVLKRIWETVLPQRTFVITGDDIAVSRRDSTSIYRASSMSDGERAILYLIGQVLCADPETLLIFDEPELHIHRSIMAKLWDQLEAERPDCAFVVVTHDLDFAAFRVGQKFVVLDFDAESRWTLEEVPTEVGFDEGTTTLILGSRRPILFVEGQRTSLDHAIYRAVYLDWTVIPKGSCEEVIRSVPTLRSNAAFTRVTCAGIIDADGRTQEQIQQLQALGVSVLKVCEIENIFLLPSIASEILRYEGLDGVGLSEKLERLTQAIYENVRLGNNIELAAVRYCQRRIDNALKKVDLSSAKIASELQSEFHAKINSLDLAAMFQARVDEISQAVQDNNLPLLLALYDNKGLLALAAQHLKSTSLRSFQEWTVRAIEKKTHVLHQAIKASLPEIVSVLRD